MPTAWPKLAEAVRARSIRVLLAYSFRTRNDLGLADTIKGSLTPQFPGRLDRLHNGVQIVIGAQIVRLDDGRIAPVRRSQAVPVRGSSAEPAPARS